MYQRGLEHAATLKTIAWRMVDGMTELHAGLKTRQGLWYGCAEVLTHQPLEALKLK